MIKNKQIAKVYWITGLSGSGKTTVAKEFIKLLNNIGHKCINIDEKKKERIMQAQKYSQMCKLFSEQGVTVVAAVGALFNSIQKWNRLNIKNYIEVFLDVPIKELKKRNKKNYIQSSTREILKIL